MVSSARLLLVAILNAKNGHWQRDSEAVFARSASDEAIQLSVPVR
jgi:hypothetical protein